MLIERLMVIRTFLFVRFVTAAEHNIKIKESSLD